MSNQKIYIIQIIKTYGQDNLDCRTASAKISTLRKPSRLHPALEYIADLADDIAHGYTEEIQPGATEQQWNELRQLANAYQRGEWPSSVYILSITYIDTTGSTHGISIKRSNGETDIQSGSTDLRAHFEELALQTNQFQADEYFLSNLAANAPTNVVTMKLHSAELNLVHET